MKEAPASMKGASGSIRELHRRWRELRARLENSAVDEGSSAVDEIAARRQARWSTTSNSPSKGGNRRLWQRSRKHRSPHLMTSDDRWILPLDERIRRRPPLALSIHRIQRNHQKLKTFLLISQQPQNRSSPNFFPTFMGLHLNFHLNFMQFHAMGDPAAHPNWILIFFIEQKHFFQQSNEILTRDLEIWILWFFLHVLYELHFDWLFSFTVIEFQDPKYGSTCTLLPNIQKQINK